MMQWIVQWPVWEMIRAFGIASFLLLFAGIMLGIMYGYPIWKGRRKTNLYKLHKLFTNAGAALVLLHGFLPVISTYMPFSWSEILIPFAAKQDTVLYGIGTLAVYGVLLLIFTSDFRLRISRKIWYGLHMLSYPVFAASVVHGFMLGTDSRLLWVRWMYVSTVLLLVLATLGRMAWKSASGQGRETVTIVDKRLPGTRPHS